MLSWKVGGKLKGSAEADGGVGLQARGPAPLGRDVDMTVCRGTPGGARHTDVYCWRRGTMRATRSITFLSCDAFFRS